MPLLVRLAYSPSDGHSIFLKTLFSEVEALFAVLEIENERESLFDRFFDLFKSPVVEKTKVEVARALPFYVIKTKNFRGALPWKEIENAAGALRSRMILPAETEIGAFSMLSRFEPAVLPKRLLFNSAVEAIEKMKIDPREVSVTLIDENGYLLDLAEKLVFLAAQIRIVTNCVAAYEQLGNLIFQRFGLSVVVSGTVDNNVLSSTFIISDSAVCVPLIFGGVLFTNEQKRMMNAAVLCPKGVTLPPEFEKLSPNGVDRLSFASALFELCGAEELGKLGFDELVSVS